MTITSQHTLLVILLTLSFWSFSQKKEKTYADCEGTINIFKSHTFDLEFTGKRSKSNRFSQYPALKHLVSGNQIWFSFVAPADGHVELDLESESVGLSLVVFDALDNNVCLEIAKGNAEIKRLISPIKSTRVGLREVNSDNYLFPVPIEAGKSLHFVVIADESSRDNIMLDFRFIASDPSFVEYSTKELNLKSSQKLSSLVIKIRDKETKEPLISDIRLKGARNIDGIYSVSDLVLDVNKNSHLEFYCEHQGYFFKDSIGISLLSKEDKEIIIEMEPIRAGKSIQIEDIDFTPGTSVITENSKPKLERLRDFLMLNPTIHVEIQGHVFEPGEHNSFAGQKMSEARAKRIMKYLAENGINESRMVAVGYGNTKPVYKTPKNFREEQVNRRVEILIK